MYVPQADIKYFILPEATAKRSYSEEALFEMQIPFYPITSTTLWQCWNLAHYSERVRHFFWSVCRKGPEKDSGLLPLAISF